MVKVPHTHSHSLNSNYELVPCTILHECRVCVRVWVRACIPENTVIASRARCEWVTKTWLEVRRVQEILSQMSTHCLIASLSR